MTLQEIHLRIEKLLKQIQQKIETQQDIKSEETELANLEIWRENIEEGL